jgi:hypothetical protein
MQRAACVRIFFGGGLAGEFFASTRNFRLI